MAATFDVLSRLPAVLITLTEGADPEDDFRQIEQHLNNELSRSRRVHYRIIHFGDLDLNSSEISRLLAAEQRSRRGLYRELVPLLVGNDITLQRAKNVIRDEDLDDVLVFSNLDNAYFYIEQQEG